jgi:hypothetical protein
MDNILSPRIQDNIRPDGLWTEQKFKTCQWCSATIYNKANGTHGEIQQEVFFGKFCSQDCEDEWRDWRYILRAEKNKANYRAKYASMTKEERKRHNRKNTLLRNPKAKQRTRYERVDVNNLVLKTI